ncbi:hypothetical protein POM88_050399 [Heracleum sosnowskyi]|uniref:Uncharacterized protein n=1 Tax=Heracleum sosnowskyi TaxID=360622 RepID=A0AAD8GYQ4_9APIA|nr:hypothetical protein POM88_050399 [Heracleum sosnowskyi]
MNEIFRSSGNLRSLSDISGFCKSDKFERSYEEFAKKKNECRKAGTYGGLGHPEAEIVTQALSYDQACLTENLSDKLTQRHLDKLIYVQMVYDVHGGNLPQENLLYFLKDGTIFVMTTLYVMMKRLEKLKYVLFIFIPKDEVYIRWRKKIQSSIDLQLKALNSRDTGYTPKYIDMDGHEVEMKKCSAYIETSFGVTHLNFSPDSEKFKCIYSGRSILNSSVEDPRAAIYQTDKDDEKLRKLRRKMIDLLLTGEDKLMENFLQKNPGFIRVANFEEYLRKNPYIDPASIC